MCDDALGETPGDLRWPSLIARAASTWAVVVGCIALLGYGLGVHILVRPVPGGALMAPGTAVAFIAAGVGLRLVSFADGAARRRAGQVLGLLVFLYGAAVLVEYATGRSVGIDLILFPGRVRGWAVNDVPGRASPYGAAAFLVIGLALALLDVDAAHGHRPARALTPATALIAFIAFLGYLFDLGHLRQGSNGISGIALSTTVSFVILALGVLACRPGRPPARALSGNGPGATMLRRIVPAVTTALLFAVLVTALGLAGPAAGQGLALTAAATIVVVTLYLVFLRTGAALDLAGRALRDEHDFSQTVLRSLREGIITIGPDGEVLQVNARWCEITGLSAQDVIGLKPPYPWWSPDQAAAGMSRFGGVLAAESNVESDMVIRRPDGTEVEVLTTATPVRNDAGLRMTVGTYRDVTERNRAEAQRRRATEQLNHFFDLSTDLLLFAGTDGYFKRLNPAWERTLGYTIEELLAQPYLEFTHPDDRESTGSEATGLAHGKETLAFENRYRCRDGSYRWLSWTATSTPDHGMIYAVGRDITEKRQADQAQALLAAIVDCSDDAIIGKTLDGIIVSWNRAAERTYGYRPDEAIGQPITLIAPPELAAEVEEISDHVRRGIPVAEHDTIRLCKDGTRLHVRVTVSPVLDGTGTVVGAASIARDITERREAERALASARDEALAAARLKSQFVAMVSHEIRTPMNGVIGLTALLLDTPLQPTQQRYAQLIRSSGRALLTIINDILDFSKIEAGKIELVEGDFELDKLIESVVQVAAEGGRDKGLEIVSCYPPALPTAVRGDDGRLRQVLLNLLGNAVKFTEHGGVTLRASRAANAPDGRPQTTFAVIDTGIGIASRDLPLLFQPFSQVDAATNRQFGGTGLGLTIARQLIELMGGQLDVRSQPGQGSQFSFTIPLPAQPNPPAPRTQASNCLSARRLLIVNDSPPSRQFLSEHASAWGMDPTAVDDGHAALDQLRSAAEHHQPYAVAIIDQHMPGLNGAHLTRRIMADPALAAIKLILLTSGSYQDEEAATAAGAAAALPKPVGPSQIYNCLLGLFDPKAAHQAQSSPALNRTSGDRGLILLAEDNEINQMVAADNLSMLGYRVDIARNGVEAVQLATTKPYRAILMDCQMPKMDGYTATAQLRHQERPDQHIPIIAMTAGALAEDKQRCLDAGMDDYLAKPIDADQLRATLTRWTKETNGDT